MKSNGFKLGDFDGQASLPQNPEDSLRTSGIGIILSAIDPCRTEQSIKKPVAHKVSNLGTETFYIHMIKLQRSLHPYRIASSTTMTENTVDGAKSAPQESSFLSLYIVRIHMQSNMSTKSFYLFRPVRHKILDKLSR
ncbi:hypothetical protein QR680_003717 [Steinernema hermaphroditum]|uniref:Uncharacterized protein n=1 Tax=Steinernema hermaphroditum TaxID=289476 RepID=A0AA39LST6_9BILA|nr:hypothetical protein QR680_003717 [Steinernema hermaphroditum]